jgi:hypothetical protein
MHPVSRHARHSFHQMNSRIDRIAKDDHIAAPDAGGCHRVFKRRLCIRSKLHDEQEIAGAERRLHRRRRDADWLQQKTGDEDRYEEHPERGLQRVQPAVPWVAHSCRRVDPGQLSGFHRPAPLAVISGMLACSCSSRCRASRAAICWACFLLEPSAADRVRIAPSATWTRTSTWKRR